MAYTMMSHYRRFEVKNNFIVRDSVLRESAECSLCSHGGSPSIINNIFEQSNGESILVDGGSPRLTNNQFLNLTGKGVIIDSKRLGTPVLSNNIFEMPGQDALVLLTGLEVRPGEVNFNKFSGNSRILIACDSKMYFTQNSIFSLISFIGNGCGGEYTFGPNFWGTNDIKAILQERITNKDKEFTLHIPTILTVPPMGVGMKN